MRSFLFVPADSERKIDRAIAGDAEALVFDLEDAVLPEHKALARATLVARLSAEVPNPRFWIRVNGPGTPALLADLAAIVALRPAGIFLPKIAGPEDVLRVDHYLSMAEVAGGVAPGAVRIIAVCTETPTAVLHMGELARIRCARLAGLTWGGEDLSAVLGASTPRAADGRWLPLYEFARSQCLLAAHSLSVMAIDTVYVDLADTAGLAASASAARRDGFTGKLAIHPAQIAAIHAGFTPDEAELERARRIVSAFAAGAGAIAFEGQMLDIPHLTAARRLLALADQH